MMGIAHN